ncbi:MAG: type II secretion system F family protein [Candidatus Omnitrophica bacterium]|nr:type II secretion system F family protein [Candidatus Omnitrophota bacterium]
MPVYTYKAKDISGKTIQATLEAQGQAFVVDAIRKKGLTIISIEESVEKKKKGISFAVKKKIKVDDLVVFARQLATMIDAGIPLVQGLDILSEQIEHKEFRNIVSRVRNDVETGSTLSEAIGRHPKVFSQLFINMVKAGESSGMLDDIMDRLAGYLEKSSALQRKISSALVYPAVVICMAFLITLILLLKVIPTFKEIFAGFGAKLPAPTLVLITISDALRSYFLLLLGVAVVLGFLISRYVRTEKGRLKYDQLMLDLPVFGILFKKVAVSKFTRTLSTLIKSGVSILAALEIVGKTAGNKVVENAVTDVRASIREGENIATPLAKSGVFPPMVVRMISVGEQTGELEKMLEKISDFYDEQVDSAVAGLTSMIEPLIIAFLGIVIGSIVIAMFMPIFKMSDIVNM